MAYYWECRAEVFVCEPKTELLAELRRRLPLGPWRVTPLSSLPPADKFPTKPQQLLLVDFCLGPATILDWISHTPPKSLHATWMLLDDSTQDLSWHLRDFGLRIVSARDVQTGDLVEAILHWGHAHTENL